MRVTMVGRCGAIALILAGLGTNAPAQEAPLVSEGGTISATFENDIFGGTDQNYTNGVRIGYLSPRNEPAGLARFGRTHLSWLTPAEDWYLTFALGQNLFTPSDITLPNPPRSERPYGAFLYGSVGIVADSGSQLDTIALDLGIVGQSALGEETQSFVHEIVGADDPRGWDTQIRDEIGFRLLYERKYRFLYDFEPGLFGLQVDAAPNFAVAIGNVDTSASAGLTLRVGDRLEDNYGPPRIRPAVSGPGFFDASDAFGWYLFAGAEARVVGYNMFLEGNLFREGAEGVTPNRIVGDFQLGLALQFKSVEVSYTHVLRTEEYSGQDGLAQFGSVNLRFKF